jgi:hypothetical protein
MIPQFKNKCRLHFTCLKPDFCKSFQKIAKSLVPLHYSARDLLGRGQHGIKVKCSYNKENYNIIQRLFGQTMYFLLSHFYKIFI